MKITSVADALAAMDYLHRRKLLCDACGINIATLQNQNYSRCAGCRPKHGEFGNLKAPNELERRLCEAVHAWVAGDDGGGTAPAPGTQSEPVYDSAPPAKEG